MPHRKLARRFEPRFGVSTSMIEQEATWLRREFDDLLVLSTNDLRERLAKSQTNLVTSDANVQIQIDSLPEREQWAIRCLFARDLFHLSALYEKFFHRYDGLKQSISESATESATARTETSPPPAPTAFKEWLFES